MPVSLGPHAFVPAALAAAAQNPATTEADLTISPEEEQRILQSLEAGTSTTTAQASSAATAAVSPPPETPPNAPKGLNLLVMKEGVYLSWSPASSTDNVAAYNVYRSTVPGTGYSLVNPASLTSPYYLDGEKSLSKPRNGEGYFYVVAAISPGGAVSPYSEESAVTPQGMEIPVTEEEKKEAEKAQATPAPAEEKILDIPERNIIKLQLPAESQLSIQGYKKVEAVFTFQDFPNKPHVGGVDPNVSTTLINQELTVNLKGKVGKNVDVNVDYSDVNRAGGVDQSKQDISIVYHGDADSAIQEVAFGDLQLYIPNTEFAGFSKQLFGLQAKLKFDRFRFTSFFAQTKGIAETKVFKGSSSQMDLNILDTSFYPGKYYRITREPGVLVQNSSEQIWVDPGYVLQLPESETYRKPFQRYLPGPDYTIDYATGIITFLKGISNTARVAVAFVKSDGTKIGFDPSGEKIDLVTSSNLRVPDNGVITDSAHLIKDNFNTTGGTSNASILLSPLYLVNYFYLGSDKIVPPQNDPDFLFQIVAQGDNSVKQTGQGDPNLSGCVTVGNPWVYDINLDQNYLSVVNKNFDPACSADPSFPLYYPERPFANLDGTTGEPGGIKTNDVYSQNSPNSQYSIHLRYKTQLNFFQLNRFNIIRGSEVVYLDGQRLRRDADYFFDYTSGFLDFRDKSRLDPNSQIVVSYEYSPFGFFSQQNILGARAEYELTERFFLGSTFLYTTSQQPIDVPQVGGTPNSLAVIDVDVRYDITPEDIQSVTGIIPGLENWRPPLTLKLSGEIAQSYYNPDTFSAEDEPGVAMVDNMEGIDSVIGPSMQVTRWLVSSAPMLANINGTPVTCNAGAGTNNRIRFYNNDNGPYFESGSVTQNLLPGAGGHVYASTGNINDAVNVLAFPYKDLTNQRWGGVRQVLSSNGVDVSNAKYFQTWIHNDGQDKWIMFDFGTMNEDSNGDGELNADMIAQGSVSIFNQANPNPNYYIPTYYFAGNSYAGTGGSSSAPVTSLLGNEQSSQEGINMGGFVTEDMNENGVLDIGPYINSYFEYGVRANWTGWQLVKIPIDFKAPADHYTTPSGISYFFNSQGNPTALTVRAMRVWITGAGPAAIGGAFSIENISFTQNLWQLQVDPLANVNQGVTINTAKFDINSISADQDSRYDSSLRFLTVQSGQDETAIKYKEKSLKITYQLSTTDMEPVGDVGGRPVYYATRNFNQGVDFTDYSELRFDLQTRSFTSGDILFIRLANDSNNYYQYNIPITSESLNFWKTITVKLDGSQGNRSKVGTPYINRTTQLCYGVISPHAPSLAVGELWVNNLRLGSPDQRTGLARRANAALVLGDNFAQVNARYREVDSGFSQIDQTSTHFQHSRQIGGDFSSSSIKLFSQPLVTQFSVTRQDLTTEPAMRQNPYYIPLPDSQIDNASGNISYSKELGPNFGRLTNVRVSGSTNTQTDSYHPDYLVQPGVQGNIRRGQDILSVASTYDAPPRLFFLPLGTNQFNQSFSLTHDIQQFDFTTFAPYDRTTRVQSYGWTNTSEIIKNLVITPGFSWSLTDAVGNTNTPGVPGGVESYTSFQQRYQPRAGIVYRGVPGVIPSVDYSGSNQYDFVSFREGPRFNSANNLNYSMNLTPGSWLPLFQKINLTVSAGRTESATSSVPDYSPSQPLSFEQRWLTNPNFDIALSGTKNISHSLNSGFHLFDVWEFQPTGSWSDQLNLLYQGSRPTELLTRTLGLNTSYNRKIVTVPFIRFSLDSARFQYTRMDSTQYDSGEPRQRASESNSNAYSFTFPYNINEKAQGNINLRRTVGYQYLNGTETDLKNDQASIEYRQKFFQNQLVTIPFTNWKIKFEQALEFSATFAMEFVDNWSLYPFNLLKTERYRGTIELDYNALKNLRIHLGVANEYFFDRTNPNDNQKDYSQWQITASGEARF